MLGDDPDTTVATVRFGSRGVFGRARGVYALCKEGLGGHGQEGSEHPIGLERSTKAKRSRGKVMKAKGETSTTNECKF